MMIAPNPSDTILVVDDTPSSLSLLTTALEEAGYTVLLAPDGQRALQIAERITPNAILMDAIMPSLDGFETSRRIKELEALRDVPVLFMTGLSDTENIVRGLEAGGVDYITKPVDPDELLARLKVHIANARNSKSAHLALDVYGRFLLSTDTAGNITWTTPQARSLLALDQEGGSAQLPRDLIEWLRTSGKMPSSNGEHTEDYFAHINEADLRFTYVGSINSREYLLRVSHRSNSPGEDILKKEFKLTDREAEVLTWITNGKSNKEIAAILDMSPRTVNKHLDRIFSKLGVENRTTAAILALRKLLG